MNLDDLTKEIPTGMEVDEISCDVIDSTLLPGGGIEIKVVKYQEKYYRLRKPQCLKHKAPEVKFWRCYLSGCKEESYNSFWFEVKQDWVPVESWQVEQEVEHLEYYDLLDILGMIEDHSEGCGAMMPNEIDIKLKRIIHKISRMQARKRMNKREK